LVMASKTINISINGKSFPRKNNIRRG